MGINTKLAMAQSIISLRSNAKVTKKCKKKQDRREKIGKVKRERWLRLLKVKGKRWLTPFKGEKGEKMANAL